MSGSPLLRVLPAALIEALAWHGIAAAFLLVYVTQHAAPIDAAPPHLALLATLWCCLLCLRLAAWRWIPDENVARWVNAAIVTSALVALVGYYALVLVGLRSWGRVVSWTLIETYALQSRDLLNALGVPATPAFAGGAAILALLLALVARMPARLDCTACAARVMSPPVVFACVFLGLSAVTLRLYAFAANPPARDGEPVSLTIFPEQATRPRQSHSIGGVPALEIAEDEVRRSYAASPDAVRRNVILIVGDALRSDHMSLNGYPRSTTPFLDSMASAGTLSKAGRMTAVCAESACGVLAILRSKYVHQLVDRAFTLPEALKRHGYRIHMILGGDHTNFYGLRQAYGQVDSYFDGASARGYHLNDDALVLDHVASLPGWDGEPVMLQFHLMSAHGLGTRHESPPRFQPEANYYGVNGKRAVRSGAADPEATNYYDNGVLQFDRMVSALLEQLELKGYLDDAIVVITGDHGELLGEYGKYAHAKSVYEPVLRVPFVLLHYGYRPEAPIEPGAVASQVDIAPTVLTELRMPVPATWVGRPLQSGARRDFVFFQQGAEVGLFDLRERGRIWKYWIDFRTGEEFAFDATGRADEANNQIDSIAVDLRREWKRQAMGGGAAVVVRQECCGSR
jgi:glucan phosphoethanolaminetransferase (alkaline phosphatase superfamily)